MRGSRVRVRCAPHVYVVVYRRVHQLVRSGRLREVLGGGYLVLDGGVLLGRL